MNELKKHLDEITEIIEALSIIEMKLHEALEEGKEFVKEPDGLFLLDLSEGVLSKSCNTCPVHYLKKLKGVGQIGG